MTLTLVAEILAGETLLSPAGPVDAITTTSDDEVLWTKEMVAELRGVAVLSHTGLEYAEAALR